MLQLYRYLSVAGVVLTVCLFSGSWPRAAAVPEVLTGVDIVYYIDFPWHKKYEAERVKGCHLFFLHLGSAVLRCEESVSLLRPLHIIKAWQQQQSKMGFFSLKIKEFGVKNAHGYIKNKLTSFNLPSICEKNTTIGSYITGKFIRHAVNVRKYRFKNRITGKLSSIRSTPDHPFYVRNRRRFIPLEAISPEDEMVQKNGQIVQMICSSPHGTHCGAGSKGSIVSVYNLEIAKKHTYFVGQDFILVHNVCTPSFALTYDLLKKHGLFTEIRDENTVDFKLPLAKRRELAEPLKERLASMRKLEADSYTDHNMLTTLADHLRNLGFVSRTGSGSFGMRDLYWQLHINASLEEYEGVLKTYVKCVDERQFLQKDIPFSVFLSRQLDGISISASSPSSPSSPSSIFTPIPAPVRPLSPTDYLIPVSRYEGDSCPKGFVPAASYYKYWQADEDRIRNAIESRKGGE